jgi:hypothetical protein
MLAQYMRRAIVELERMLNDSGRVSKLAYWMFQAHPKSNQSYAYSGKLYLIGEYYIVIAKREKG